ncbi:uncharacterized protein LOC133321592, partial [Musca vetustissima]
DIMDIMALINSSINFILYCSMSRQFRTTFTLLFRPKFLDRWLPVAQDEETMAGTNRPCRQSNRGGQGPAPNGIRRDEVSKSCVIEQNQMTTTQVTNV